MVLSGWKVRRGDFAWIGQFQVCRAFAGGGIQSRMAGSCRPVASIFPSLRIGDGADALIVTGQGVQEPSIRRVPDAYGLIVTGTGQLPAVGLKAIPRTQ